MLAGEKLMGGDARRLRVGFLAFSSPWLFSPDFLSELSAVVADVLIMPVFDDDEPTTLGLPAAPQSLLAAARKQREFKAKPYEQYWMAAPSDWKTPRILALGAGARRDYSSERARRLAMAGGLAARSRNLGRVAFVQRGIGSAGAGTNGP